MGVYRWVLVSFVGCFGLEFMVSKVDVCGGVVITKCLYFFGVACDVLTESFKFVYIGLLRVTCFEGS